MLPLFLHAGIPASFQNYGDPDSKSLTKPVHPGAMEDMDAEEKARELDLYRRRHAHFYYMGATASKNNAHFNALMQDGDLLRRKVFQHAGAPWEGNNFLLKADLVMIARYWEDLLLKATDGSHSQPCPICFETSQIETIRDAIIRQEEADEQLGIIRQAIGIGLDGWVSHEDFEDAKVKAAEMQAEALRSADDDHERELIIRHWPFDDHDELE